MPEPTYLERLTELRDLCNERVFDEDLSSDDRRRFLLQAQGLTVRITSLRAARFDENTERLKNATRELKRVNETLKSAAKDIDKVINTLNDITKAISAVDEVIGLVKDIT